MERERGVKEMRGYTCKKFTRLDCVMILRLGHREKLCSLSPPGLQGEKGGSGGRDLAPDVTITLGDGISLTATWSGQGSDRQ